MCSSDLAKAPLCFGFLNGRYNGVTAFPANDHRRKIASSKREFWAAGAEILRTRLENLARSLLQVALQFILAEPLVIPIPGMKTPSQVAENVRATSLPPLSSEQILLCRQIYLDCLASTPP